MIAPNVYPSFLKWMPGDDEIIVFNNAQKKGRQVIKEADIIFCIDFNDLSRVKLINELVDQSDAVKVLIDHHPTENYFGDVIFCDTDASSTAELIFEFIRIMGYRNNIDAETATCIFAGIMTDTGCFSYNSSNPRTYEIIASLLEYGFNKDQVYYNVYDNFSGDRMRLLGHILNDKMEIYEEFHTAALSLTRDEQRMYHFQPGDSEGFVNYPLSVKNIKFSAFFIEKEDHVKISFRSKGTFDVNRFARLHFNGGGHVNASGGESMTTLEAAMSKFRETLELYKKVLRNETS